jgi:signal transduction histidine kinase
VTLARRVKLLVVCAGIAALGSEAINVGLKLWTSAIGAGFVLAETAAVLISWPWLKERVSMRAIAHGTLGACTVAICLVAYGEGTTRTPNLYFHSLTVVSSALLLGVRASRFWAGASLAASAITFGADVAFRGVPWSAAANTGLGFAIVLVVLHLLSSAAWRIADTSLMESERAAARARAAAIELESANAQLAAAMDARSRFLANMSHEIRTPLNAVLGFTDVLLGMQLEEEQRQYVETIRSAGQGLLVVVDDVLDLARIEAGRLGLASGPVDIGEAIAMALEMLAVAAHKKGLEIWSQVDADAPAQIVADAARVRQVLLNLIGNAVKFTADGEVVVRLRASADGTMARVEVRDTGPGIARTAFDNLFQAFGQEDGSTRRRHGGTGLGLVISKKLIDGMGGHIGFESELGKGSCFWFELPRGEHVNAKVEDVRGLGVVLVEGRPGPAAELARALAPHVGGGVARVPAGSSAAAVRDALPSASRIVAIVDWDPAAPSPTDLVTELSQTTGRVTGVIVLAPLTEQTGRRDVRWPARVTVQNKPARVLRLLQRLGAISRDERPPTSIPPPAASTFEHRVLLVEDNLVNQRVGRLMLEACGCTVRVAEGGAAAVREARAGGLDLILMDLHMPDMDGFDATRSIRTEERDAGRAPIPIVALSATVLPEDQARCLEAGMNGHLAKPISKKALEMLLRGIPQKAVA